MESGVENRLKKASDRLLGTNDHQVWPEIPLAEIKENPDQPRKVYNAQKMKEIEASIKERGVLQPIIVRRIDDPDADKKFELIAGHRRVRASIAVGLTMIPAVITVTKGNDRHTIALIENLSREDLKPLDTICSVGDLAQKLGSTDEVVNELKLKDRTVRRYVKTFKALNSVPQVLERLNGRLKIQAKEDTKVAQDDFTDYYELAEVMEEIRRLSESKSKTDQREFGRILGRIEKQDLKSVARKISKDRKGGGQPKDGQPTKDFFTETDHQICIHVKLLKTKQLTEEDKKGIKEAAEKFLAAIENISVTAKAN